MKTEKSLVFGCLQLASKAYWSRLRLVALPPQVAVSTLWFDDVLTAKVEGAWLGEGMKIPHSPIYVRPCYVKMKGLLFDIGSLTQKERLTYVVRGTPGIGKTTMLFYLLWECMREESPFTAVLFATNKDVFVARKTFAGWAKEAFKRGSRVSSFGGGFGDGRAIGLVDVNPEGEIKEQGTVIMGFNTQAPCSEFGLHRLVVVSSAGAQLSQLIDKTGDKFPPKVVYLPVWKAEQTQAWVFKSHPDAIQQWDNIEANAGFAVPRLVELFLYNEFQATLERFMDRIAGKNTLGKKSSSKDAHTMVLLRGSTELMEDIPSACATKNDDEEQSIIPPFELHGKAGSEIGLASVAVESKIYNLRHDCSAITEMIRLFPKTVAYLFEGLVLNRLVHESGLQLQGKDCALTLRFSERCELWGAKTMRDGVLYRPRGDDYPAIDACGVPANEAEGTSPKFVLMQITTGREHRRIQKCLVEKVPIPKGCKGGVLCLYIVPSSVSSLKLTDGANALKEGMQKGGKAVSEMVVSASSVLEDLPEDVRQKFAPGMKY